MRSNRLASLIFALASCLTACTGTITGNEANPPVGDDDDDQPPLPGTPDAGPDDPPLPGEPDAAPPTPDPDPLAAGIHIGEVAVFQSVRVVLAKDGTAVAANQRNAPVIEGRDALFAVRFTVDSGFQGRGIEARVTIDGTTYKAEQNVAASSGDAPSSQLRVKVPGSAIKINSTFEVSLHEASGTAVPGSTDDSRYPASGTAAMSAISVNGSMHLVLVPFRYNADGSGRLPPLDAASIQAHKDAFQAMYPVAEMEVTVHDPVDTSIAISSGDSWGQYLDQLDEVRQQDNPPSNYYYYGLSAPATTFSRFCNGGCIVGLGHVPGATNSFLFASVGVSFPGALLSDTALHEVGHTMGRSHVDCGGPAGPDPNYPYPGDTVGVWGWDPVEDKFKDPGTFSDIMGYCNAQWISDYQYGAIQRRLTTVNGNAPRIVGLPQKYRVGVVAADGTVTWKRFVDMVSPPEGGLTLVNLRGVDGSSVGEVSGHLFPYDHMAGGTLYMPVTGTLDTASLAIGGFVRP